MRNDPNHKTSVKSNFISAVCSPEKVAVKLSKNRKNLYRLPLDLFAELIQFQSQIPILVELEKKCFPTLMQDQRQDLEEFFNDSYASGLILYKDAVPIGYIMGSHIHEENSARALETNDFIQEHQEKIFYISSLSIIKEYRSVIALEFLIHEMTALLKSIGYEYFVAYVRKRNGLSRLLKSRASCEILHTQENWEETGEPFDFCLVNLSSIPSLPVYADYIFHWLRMLRQKCKGTQPRTS